MRKFSAKWVLKCLNAEQTRQRCQSCEQILEFFGTIQMISCRARLVTMDETWFYHHDPETKQQSVELQQSGSTRPKKFRVKKSAGKFLASIFFWIKTSSSSLILFQRAKLSTRMTVGHLRESVRRKRPEIWRDGDWILHHDNAPAHTTSCVAVFGQTRHRSVAAAAILTRSRTV